MQKEQESRTCSKGFGFAEVNQLAKAKKEPRQGKAEEEKSSSFRFAKEKQYPRWGEGGITCKQGLGFAEAKHAFAEVKEDHLDS